MYKIILLLFVSQTLCYKLECNDQTSVDISSGNYLPGDKIYHQGILYKRYQYYISNATNKAMGCICDKKECIRKCCPMGFGYSASKTCNPIDEVFNPPLFDKYGVKQYLNATDVFRFVFGKVGCGKSVRLKASKISASSRLQVDGQLFIELPSSQPPWYRLKSDQYCIDTFLHRDPKTNEVFTKLDALVCFPDEDVENNYAFSYICMLISCVFFVITIAVYLWVPELRNLHGRVLVAYLMCLLVGFMFLATVQILVNIDHTSVILCLTFSFIIYFSLLSAFFWLNVMCFDIWWTFSGKRGLSLEKLTTRARFNAYAAYAFGIPTGLTILLISLEFSGLPPQTFLPMLRIQGCFLYGTSKLIYLYGPIILLCVSNMVFFTLTAVKIHQIKKETAMLKSKDSSTHDQHRSDEQRLLLYVKLFSVMGINWILEVLSAIYPDANVFWRFTDAYNVLVGLIIFIIFVCKKKTIRLLKKRFKETFRSQSDSEDRPGHRDLKNWREYQQQRGSLDTVRTSICFDSDWSRSTTKTSSV